MISKNILRHKLLHSFLLQSSKSCSSLINLEKLLDSNKNDIESQASVPSKIQSGSDFVKGQYYVEGGLRKVYPYYFRHEGYCKGRWINKTLKELYCSEFGQYPEEEITRRIDAGVVRVNGEVVNPDYKLKNKDYLTSVIHRHELGVLAAAIKIIHEDDDIIVVDKPPSITIHPCGLYRYNSLQYLLSGDGPLRNFFVCHRLDKLTSGILMFGKTTEKSRQLHSEMRLRDIKKQYLCRVEGDFPDHDIVCNKSLKQIYNRIGISIVAPDGKVAITKFQKISYNGKSSVILCRPLTGRTHQIRVHLQYLGYPILNDPLYNSYAFGPDKGKHGKYNKSLDSLIEDVLKEHSGIWWLNAPEKAASEMMPSDVELLSKVYPVDQNLLSGAYEKDPTKVTYNENCYFCDENVGDPKPEHLFMLLHAHKYSGKKWAFETDIPVWAYDDWDVM